MHGLFGVNNSFCIGLRLVVPQPEGELLSQALSFSFNKIHMTRRLKIQGEYRRSTDLIKRRYSSGWHVPMLLLKGKWLEKAGFNAFEYARITIQDNKLIIEPSKKGETDDK